MCCAAGLPMQVALNVLLKQARPHRLLIEPTGLGHPKEVLQVLGAKHYQSVLDIQNTVTLVDARKIADSKYTEHAIFFQQLEVADVVVANKSDQYQKGELDLLKSFFSAQRWSKKPIHAVSMGQLSIDWLSGKANSLTPLVSDDAAMLSVDLSATMEKAFPACGYLSYARTQAELMTKGWRFNEEFIFNRQRLYQLIASTPIERIKGVFITDEGVYGYNMSEDALSEIPLSEAVESSVEIIALAGDPCDEFEVGLLALAVRVEGG